MEMQNVNSDKKGRTQYALDDVLKFVGKFGLYHLFVYLIICIGVSFSSSYALGFVFTAGEVNYRCHIPECEDLTSAQYSTDWLSRAVPFEGDKPSSCLRYAVYNASEGSCWPGNFDRSVEYDCTDMVFDDYENTIVKEFDLTCSKKWMVSLVGTMHNVGHFLNLMISGYFSDKYGRKIVFIFSLIAGGAFPVIRSFSWNYASFVSIELVDTLFVAGVYTAGFLLAVEIVSPELRALGGVVIFCSASIGKAFIGMLMWWLRDWKLLLIVNNSPSIILGIACIFVVPESFRWLLSKGKNAVVAKHLLKSAKVNNIELPEDINDVLVNRPEDILLDTQENLAEANSVKTNANEYNLKEIFGHPKFLVRIAICAYCWLTNIFVFYGLSLTAVTIGGNKYTDFTYVAAIEIPATFLVIYAADRLGRKFLLISAFIVSGIALLVSTFVPEVYWVNLTLFLIGKFSISVAFCTMYTFTSEIFPTNLRHTLLGFCSGFGRLGSLIATQAPLLQTVSRHLPTYLFAGTALIAGALSLTFPETFKTKLPDTIEDAMNIGKTKEERNNH